MYYFAYATNIDKKRMTECCPGSTPKYTVVLPNYKLIFTGWSRQWKGGTASIKPFKGEKVPGVLYELSETDLRRLDNYEGYPALSERLNITVWTDTGDPVAAVTYIKREQSQETKPSESYLAIIQKGYREWQIE
jgi:hypothetical protein